MPTDYAKKEEKRFQPVAAGGVEKRKKGVGKKFFEYFFEEMTIEEAIHMFVYERLFPSLKDGIHDAFNDFVDTLFYGRPTGRHHRPQGGGNYTSYSNYSKQQQSRPQSRGLYSFDDVSFETRQAANDTLKELIDGLRKFGEIRVADFYDAAGVTGSGHSDNYFGWTDLSGAYVSRYRDRFIINMPKVIELDDK